MTSTAQEKIEKIKSELIMVHTHAKGLAPNVAVDIWEIIQKIENGDYDPDPLASYRDNNGDIMGV